MTETTIDDEYKTMFLESDRTDAILVVGDKKLHVNKAHLSYHSDYFNILFNANVNAKEFPIENVRIDFFATVLCMVQNERMTFYERDIEEHLEVAEKFQLPSSKRYLEATLFSNEIEQLKKFRIADKFQLNELMDFLISSHNEKHVFKELTSQLSTFADTTNVKLFRRALEVFVDKSTMKKRDFDKTIYEKTFAKTDKTDAILVVGDKKMHVNKALLSYHSDYFNTLFNSDFKEKSMNEIPIDDVIFEDFAAFLSLIQYNPIMPTESNAEKLLELSDRFLLPIVKKVIEHFLSATKIDRMEKIRIADKYQLSKLLRVAIASFKQNDDFKNLQGSSVFEELSDKTKVEMFKKLVKISF